MSSPNVPMLQWLVATGVSKVTNLPTPAGVSLLDNPTTSRLCAVSAAGDDVVVYDVATGVAPPAWPATTDGASLVPRGSTIYVRVEPGRKLTASALAGGAAVALGVTELGSCMIVSQTGQT